MDICQWASARMTRREPQPTGQTNDRQGRACSLKLSALMEMRMVAKPQEPA
jgi:hypothetical protein